MAGDSHTLFGPCWCGADHLVPTDWPTVDDMAVLNKTMPKGMAVFTVDSLAAALKGHSAEEWQQGPDHMATAIIQAAKETQREHRTKNS